jgi:hypothetical protein
MSRHLLGTALFLWLLGVVVYVVGFYHEQLNGLAIVPRAIISRSRCLRCPTTWRVCMRCCGRMPSI